MQGAEGSTETTQNKGNVEDALVADDQQPAVGTHDIRRPERQNGDDKNDLLPAFGNMKGKDIGKRIGKDHTQRSSALHLDRVAKRREQVVAREELDVVLQGPVDAKTPPERTRSSRRSSSQAARRRKR